MNAKSYLSLTMLSAVSIALTACGGGSSSSSSGGVDTSSKQELTSSNIGNVATILSGSTSLTSSAMSSTVNSSGSRGAVILPQSVLSKTVAEVIQASELSKSSSLVAKQATERATQTVSCPSGGTVTVTANGSGNNVSGSITYKQCKENTTMMDGKMLVSIAGSNTSVTIPNWKLTSPQINISLTNSAVSEGANGASYLNFTGVISVKSNGVTESVELSRYEMRSERDLSSNVGFVTLSGSIKTNCMNGWVTITTEERMATTYGDYCPTSGMFHYSGASNNVMSLHATSQGGMNVLLNGIIKKSYVSCRELERSSSSCPAL